MANPRPYTIEQLNDQIEDLRLAAAVAHEQVLTLEAQAPPEQRDDLQRFQVRLNNARINLNTLRNKIENKQAVLNRRRIAQGGIYDIEIYYPEQQQQGPVANIDISELQVIANSGLDIRSRLVQYFQICAAKNANRAQVQLYLGSILLPDERELYANIQKTHIPFPDMVRQIQKGLSDEVPDFISAEKRIDNFIRKRGTQISECIVSLNMLASQASLALPIELRQGASYRRVYDTLERIIEENTREALRTHVRVSQSEGIQLTIDQIREFIATFELLHDAAPKYDKGPKTAALPQLAILPREYEEQINCPSLPKVTDRSERNPATTSRLRNNEKSYQKDRAQKGRYDQLARRRSLNDENAPPRFNSPHQTMGQQPQQQQAQQQPQQQQQLQPQNPFRFNDQRQYQNNPMVYQQRTPQTSHPVPALPDQWPYKDEFRYQQDKGNYAKRERSQSPRYQSQMMNVNQPRPQWQNRPNPQWQERQSRWDRTYSERPKMDGWNGPPQTPQSRTPSRERRAESYGERNASQSPYRTRQESPYKQRQDSPYPHTPQYNVYRNQQAATYETRPPQWRARSQSPYYNDVQMRSTSPGFRNKSNFPYQRSTSPFSIQFTQNFNPDRDDRFACMFCQKSQKYCRCEDQ